MSLTFEDVLSFPEEARVCFSSQPELYQQFMDVMNRYANEQYERCYCCSFNTASVAPGFVCCKTCSAE